VGVMWEKLVGSRLFWEAVVVAALLVILTINLHRLDTWRGLVRAAEVERQLHALNEETKIREQTIEHLKTAIAERDVALEQVRGELAAAKARRPVLAVVKKKIQEGTITDDGLLQESQRLLPGVGVRLARDCR
jgi:hypothetical protein